MDKLNRNRKLGIGLIILGILGFILLYSTKNQFFILSGFILPIGILLYLKSKKIDKKKLESIVVVSFLFCLAFSLTLNDFYENNELSKYGIITKGRVIEKKFARASKAYRYTITYVFLDKNGQYYTDNKGVGYTSRYDKGDTINVIYSSKNNSINDISYKNIDSRPEFWSFAHAIWKSSLGLKKIIVIFAISIVVIYSIGFAAIIGLQIISWIYKLFNK